MSGWIEPFIHVHEVENTGKNRRTFRTVAREICGESMEPSQGSMVWFGEIDADIKDPIICVASATPADSKTTDVSCREYFNWIDFLFVHKDYQKNGYGSIMIQAVEQVLRKHKERPIRIESAVKAVEFFKKLGYKEIGGQLECIHPSSQLFSVLQPMQKFSS